MSLTRLHVALVAGAVACIILALIATARTDLTALGVSWPTWLCAALMAFLGSLLVRELKP